MELNYEKLAITGTDGLVLVLFHAVPGSAAAQSLTLLAHLATDNTAAAPVPEDDNVRRR
ncbi:hypothetical protein ACTWQN_08845 [Saccharopolyspora sp. 5N708]